MLISNNGRGYALLSFMDMQSLVCNLNGYLLSLRRLSGNKCDFWADTFLLNDDIKESLLTHLKKFETEIHLVKQVSIGYSEFEEILQKHIFSNLIVSDKNLFKLFSWDIMEFIEMTYRSIEPEINPLSKREAIAFNVHSSFHGDYIYVVIPVEEKAVIVGLATRA